MTPVIDDASVVEAMARAMFAADAGDWPWERLAEVGDTRDGALFRQDYRRYARAALTALREKDGWRQIGELTRKDGAVLARRAVPIAARMGSSSVSSTT